MEYFIKSELHELSAIDKTEIAFYYFENIKRIPVPKIRSNEIIKTEGL